jgi:hypothetical protein
MVAKLETPRTAFPDTMLTDLGGIWGGVFDHYGINLSGKIGKYGVVVAALSQTVAMVGPAIATVRAEIEAKDKAKPKPAAPPPAPMPSSSSGDIRPTWPQ